MLLTQNCVFSGLVPRQTATDTDLISTDSGCFMIFLTRIFEILFPFDHRRGYIRLKKTWDKRCMFGSDFNEILAIAHRLFKVNVFQIEFIFNCPQNRINFLYSNLLLRFFLKIFNLFLYYMLQKIL